MLLLLVLMGMLTVIVFAGSPGVGFSFHYTANHSVLTRNGEKPMQKLHLETTRAFTSNLSRVDFKLRILLRRIPTRCH